MSQVINMVYDIPHTIERGIHRLKRIDLRMNEQQKYDVIKSLVDHNSCKKAAAVKLGCTTRHVNRLIKLYREHGREAFIHGNRGRKPAHSFTDEQKLEMITVYSNKYYDATFSYACELMAQNDGIIVSPSAFSKIMYENFITSPRTTKAVRKRLAKELRIRKNAASSKKKTDALQAAIVSVEDSHSRRPRCAYFGEMLQMDASVHLWFGDSKANLHIAIDDSTSRIVGAYFDGQESLNGYYNVFHQILTDYGIPAMFYTDRRTVFEYRNKNMDKAELDTYTQFSYACKQLGVEIKTTSVAQAKGRVERAFQTLQQRLPTALRLAGITTISEANIFLHSYIKEYNAKFALPVNNNRSVFEKQPDNETISQILAVLTERCVDCGHCIKFQKQYYRTIDEHGLQVHYHKGTKGLVIQTFDKKLLFSVHDKIYELEAVPAHEVSSKSFDFKPLTEHPRKRSIPSPRHPWRNTTFNDFRTHSVTESMLMC